MRKPDPSGAISSELAVFGRLLQADRDDLARPLAKHILTLGFPPADQVKMQDLAERNQAGMLSSKEKSELRTFVKAGHLLALLHSKARKSLQRKKAT